MKKKLESELMSIAHRILKLKGKEDVIRMQLEARELYEKLSVLKFAQENFEDDLPTIGNDSSFFDMLDVAFNNKVSDNIEIEDKIYINLDENEDDDIMEPVMEKIKDMVAQMPPEAATIDKIFEEAIPQTQYHKNDLEDITADFKEMPIFDPVEEKSNTEKKDVKKSLNDKLKAGFLIGLNDKIAFIKHLFDGNSEDFDRVISLLNTASNFEEANHIIKAKVKPDYNFWLGKEEYAERFIEIVEAKFN